MDDACKLISLEEVIFGRWKYRATENEGIELLHRDDSPKLLHVRTYIHGTNNAPPATFVLSSITALDLALVTSSPGCLEGMEVRCVLETDSRVMCEENRKGTQFELACHLVTLKASAYNAGELRDMLLEISAACGISRDQPAQMTAQAVQLDALSPWVLHVPPRLYRRKVRIAVEKLLLAYTVLSVLWAGWQLYRHVHIIHVTFQPFIDLLNKYLASVIGTFDAALVVITDLWTHLFSPLSIFLGTVVTPLLGSVGSIVAPLLGSVGAILTPLLGSIGAILTPLLGSVRTLLAPCSLLATYVWQVLTSSSLMLAIRDAVLGAHAVLGTCVYRLLSALLWPLQLLCLYVMRSPLGVASLDAGRVRLNWVMNLVISSSKAIGKGTVTLFNYLMWHKHKKTLSSKSPSRSHLSPSRAHLSPSRAHLSPSRAHLSLSRAHLSPSRAHLSPSRLHKSPTRL